MITLENNKPSLCIPSSFKTRQEAPEVFDMNASIYFWKKDALFNQKTLFQKIHPFMRCPSQDQLILTKVLTLN